MRARLFADAFSSDAMVRQDNSQWRRATEVKELFLEIYQKGWYVKTRTKTVGPFHPRKVLELDRAGNLPATALLRQGSSSRWLPAAEVVQAIHSKQNTLSKIAELSEVARAPKQPDESLQRPSECSDIGPVSTGPNHRTEPQATAATKSSSVTSSPLVVPAVPARHEPVIEVMPIVSSIPVEITAVVEVSDPGFSEVPTSPHSSTQALLPTNPQTFQAKRAGNGGIKRISRSPYFKGLLIAGVLVVCFAGIAAVIWKGFPNAGLDGVVQSANGMLMKLPGLDSHQKVLNDYEAFLNESEAAAPIFDSQERMKALQSRARQSRALLDRALALGTLEKNEHRKLLDSFEERWDARAKQRRVEEKEKVEEIVERRKTSLSELKGKARAREKVVEETKQVTAPPKLTMEERRQRLREAAEEFSKFNDVAKQILFLNQAFFTVFAEKWAELPEPSSDIEQAEHDIILMDREVFVAYASVDTEADYQNLEEILDSATNRIEAIFSKFTFGPPRSLGRRSSLFKSRSPYNSHFSVHTFEILERSLADLYSESKVRAAARRYIALLQEVDRG